MIVLLLVRLLLQFNTSCEMGFDTGFFPAISVVLSLIFLHDSFSLLERFIESTTMLHTRILVEFVAITFETAILHNLRVRHTTTIRHIEIFLRVVNLIHRSVQYNVSVSAGMGMGMDMEMEMG